MKICPDCNRPEPTHAVNCAKYLSPGLSDCSSPDANQHRRLFLDDLISVFRKHRVMMDEPDWEELSDLDPITLVCSSATRHGCSCGECHWCTWETDRVESIKMFLRRSAERCRELEKHREEARMFYQADLFRGEAKRMDECLCWIEKMQVAEKSS